MNSVQSRTAHRAHARSIAWAAAACAALSLIACTSLGTGSGAVSPGGAPVTFNWTSKDGGTTGTMTAGLKDGSTFTGPFVQMTNAVRVEALEPMWSGWRRGWGDWRYWGRGPVFPETAFGTQYTGKVVANLQGPGEQRMRCRFHLNSPQSGMGGGGQGECQLGSGSTVDAVFTAS